MISRFGQSKFTIGWEEECTLLPKIPIKLSELEVITLVLITPYASVKDLPNISSPSEFN